ncbi:hypothetical protein [Solirhodobacter olei]|uniref:hypothetical protein n=1 Tax=Solirhodobacter olei TaxID=2493082 RepID=UPI000FDBA999|nr:hypothetical protein [Solirhodobacter olei]
MLLYVHRHYTDRGREIAGVTVMAASKTLNPLALAARDAFLALGYTIENTHTDTYEYPLCNGNHSSHETLAAYDRIEKALRM